MVLEQNQSITPLDGGDICPQFRDIFQRIFVGNSAPQQFRENLVTNGDLLCQTLWHFLKDFTNDILEKIAHFRTIINVELFKAWIPVQVHRRPTTDIPCIISEHEKLSMVSGHTDILNPPCINNACKILWLSSREAPIKTKPHGRKSPLVDQCAEVLCVPDSGGPSGDGKGGWAGLTRYGADKIEKRKLPLCDPGYPSTGGEDSDRILRRLARRRFKSPFRLRQGNGEVGHGFSFLGLPPFFPFSLAAAVFFSDFTEPPLRPRLWPGVASLSTAEIMSPHKIIGRPEV